MAAAAAMTRAIDPTFAIEPMLNSRTMLGFTTGTTRRRSVVFPEPDGP
jgi:hypothetical protein